MHSGSKDLSNIPPAVSYVMMLKKLRSSHLKKMDGSPVPKSSPSAGWCMKIAHKTQVASAPEWRVIVTNNLHTRLYLDAQLRALTDAGTVMMGTVRLNIVESKNSDVIMVALANFQQKDQVFAGFANHICVWGSRHGVRLRLYPTLVSSRERTRLS